MASVKFQFLILSFGYNALGIEQFPALTNAANGEYRIQRFIYNRGDSLKVSAGSWRTNKIGMHEFTLCKFCTLFWKLHKAQLFRAVFLAEDFLAFFKRFSFLPTRISKSSFCKTRSGMPKHIIRYIYYGLGVK